MYQIIRNPDTGNIEISDMRYVMTLTKEDEEKIAKLIQKEEQKDDSLVEDGL